LDPGSIPGASTIKTVGRRQWAEGSFVDMFLTTLRSLLLISLALIVAGAARAQTDPYAETLARIRPIIMSGNDKAQKKDYDGAIADFTEAIKLGKDLPDQLRAGPYVNRGMAYADKGDLDTGLADLNKAIKLWSNNFYAYQDRGEIYRKRNEFDSAIADFSKVIKLSSQFFPAYESRGLVLLAEGKDAEADADFAKYLQMYPNGKDALDKQIAEVKSKRIPKP